MTNTSINLILKRTLESDLLSCELAHVRKLLARVTDLVDSDPGNDTIVDNCLSQVRKRTEEDGESAKELHEALLVLDALMDDLLRWETRDVLEVVRNVGRVYGYGFDGGETILLWAPGLVGHDPGVVAIGQVANT